jgi:hypothetical protein
MASADSLALLRPRVSLGQFDAFPLTPPSSTVCVLMTFWASLLLASLPPAFGLTTRSYSCGQEFASGSFSLRLTARPNLQLRLASSPPSGSFHPDSPSNLPSTRAHAPSRAAGRASRPASEILPNLDALQQPVKVVALVGESPIRRIERFTAEQPGACRPARGRWE